MRAAMISGVRLLAGAALAGSLLVVFSEFSILQRRSSLSRLSPILKVGLLRKFTCGLAR